MEWDIEVAGEVDAATSRAVLADQKLRAEYLVADDGAV
jgi:hypothetical protein